MSGEYIILTLIAVAQVSTVILTFYVLKELDDIEMTLSEPKYIIKNEETEINISKRTCDESWHKVEDELPPKENDSYSKDVLVCTKYGIPKMGYYCFNNNKWHGHNQYTLDGVVAWMEIPEYEEETNE